MTFLKLTRPHRNLGRTRAAAVGIAALAALSTAPSAAGQSAEQIMETMQELDIEFVGIATDIRDRQNLGARDTPDGVVVYAWDVERTADDRVAREQLLSVEHLQAAGIPAVRGSSPEFERGMFGGSRYRLGGTLTGLEIKGNVRYEVKVNVKWQLFDTESSSVIWEGASSSMKRGAALGSRGESDNVLLNGVLDALDSVLDDEVADAIKAS